MEFTKNCQKSALRVLAETNFFITLSIFTQNPDEYAAMLAMLNRRCSLLIVHMFSTDVVQ